MKKTRTIKALTLFSFTLLLISFIAFKAGAFDKFLKSETSNSQILNSEQAIILKTIPVDTSPVKKADTMKANPTILSTSKSVIIIDQKLKFPIKDSLKKDTTKHTPNK
jgi:hypothetical protein